MTAINDVFHDSDQQQVDAAAAEAAFNEGTDNMDAVNVPELTCPLSQAALNNLQQLIDPLAESPDQGLNLYFDVLNAIDRFQFL